MEESYEISSDSCSDSDFVPEEMDEGDTSESCEIDLTKNSVPYAETMFLAAKELWKTNGTKMSKVDRVELMEQLLLLAEQYFC